MQIRTQCSLLAETEQKRIPPSKLFDLSTNIVKYIYEFAGVEAHWVGVQVLAIVGMAAAAGWSLSPASERFRPMIGARFPYGTSYYQYY